MAATIKIKNSSTTGAVPTSGDLVQGELAVNVTDTGLYTENASGTVVKLNAPSIDDKNTGATKHLTISTGGNLGLGVTPAAKFHLLSTGSTSADGIRLTLGSEARVHNIYSDLSTGRDLLVAPYRSLTLKAGTGTTEGEVRLQSYESTIFYTGSAYSERMRLDASGNLGIGTTSPAISGYLVANIKGGASTAPAISLDATGTGTSGRQFLIYTTGTPNNGLIFYDQTAAAERARIDSSGNLLVGTTASPDSVATGVGIGGGQIQATRNSTNPNIIMYKTSGFTGEMIRFNYTSTDVGSIDITTTATSYNTSSDYRLKENIQPMTGALSVVSQLKPCTYTWKSTGESGQGFIAHELQAVVPDAVVGTKDAVDEDGNPKYQGIDTSFLVATLTAAIQELKAELDAAKARITALEA